MATGDPSIGGNDLGFVRRDDDHSRCSVLGRRMSASGYKQTCGGARQKVRFTPESGRSTGCRWMSAYDPKRTLGHFGLGSDMLACLPQVHQPEFGDGCLHFDRTPAAVADQSGAPQTLIKNVECDC